VAAGRLVWLLGVWLAGWLAWLLGVWLAGCIIRQHQ